MRQWISTMALAVVLGHGQAQAQTEKKRGIGQITRGLVTMAIGAVGIAGGGILIATDTTERPGGWAGFMWVSAQEISGGLVIGVGGILVLIGGVMALAGWHREASKAEADEDEALASCAGPSDCASSRVEPVSAPMRQRVTEPTLQVSVAPYVAPSAAGDRGYGFAVVERF